MVSKELMDWSNAETKNGTCGRFRENRVGTNKVTALLLLSRERGNELASTTTRADHMRHMLFKELCKTTSLSMKHMLLTTQVVHEPQHLRVTSRTFF